MCRKPLADSLKNLDYLSINLFHLKWRESTSPASNASPVCLIDIALTSSDGKPDFLRENGKRRGPDVSTGPVSKMAYPIWTDLAQ